MLQGPAVAALRSALALRRRSIHSSARQHVQRLLWAGSVLDQTSSSLREVPKDWLLAMGMQADVEQGLSFTKLASSPSHTLVSYVSLPLLLPVACDDDPSSHRTNPDGLHKVAAIGRNTYGELGLGFASQESTWGMVSSGFDGAGGIKRIASGLGRSLIVTDDGQEGGRSTSRLFAFGNHTSGQLGLGGLSKPYALSIGGEPELELFSSPKRVTIDDEDTLVTIDGLSSGLDHTVLLVQHSDGHQAVYTCGINTDGQLGDPSVRISSPAFRAIPSFEPPLPPSEHDPIVGVAAGGDTSALWTASGRIWTWGNSEYGQALVGGKAIDQIRVPTEASDAVAAALGPDGGKVVDIRLGGSFVVLLDDRGNVYTAGFGALGQGKERLQSLQPQRILQNASKVSAGLELASAVVHGDVGTTELAVWGLDSAAGRLGLGVRKPYPSFMIASRFTPQEIDLRTYAPVLARGLRPEWVGRSASTSENVGVLDVVHGREATFVLVEDGHDEVGRWEPKED